MIDYDEIDESQVDELIEKISNFAVTRGLETPAVLFLEANKPLGFMASQGTIVAAPFLAPVFGIDKIGQLSKLLSNKDYIEKLIVRIEEKAARKNQSAVKE